MYIPMSTNFHDDSIEHRVPPTIEWVTTHLDGSEPEPYFRVILQGGALTIFFTPQGLTELSEALRDALEFRFSAEVWSPAPIETEVPSVTK